MSSFRTFVPPPLRALSWRLPWVLTTDAYARAPLATMARAVRFTLAELRGGERILRTEDGLVFASMPNNFSSFALFVGGARDPLIWRFIERQLKPRGVFIDAGANIGAYSLPAARLVSEAGRVVAFEAHPTTFGYLARNVAMNELHQVTALNLALGAAPGHVVMEFNAANPGETHVGSTCRGATVRLTTLDAALAELGIAAIDYLKVDVEGFELAVLQGARNTIAASPDIVIQTELQEQHARRYGHRIQDIASLLRDWGLVPHGVDHQGATYPLGDDLPGDTIWLRG